MIEYTVCEFFDNKNNPVKSNFVKINNCKHDFCELNHNGKSGVFHVINEKNIPENYIAIPFNIREFFEIDTESESENGTENGTENNTISVILMKKIDKINSDVILDVKSEKNNGLMDDFDFDFVVKNKNFVFTPYVKYIHNVNERKYTFSIIDPFDAHYTFIKRVKSIIT